VKAEESKKVIVRMMCIWFSLLKCSE